jgi:peroxiredoxin
MPPSEHWPAPRERPGYTARVSAPAKPYSSSLQYQLDEITANTRSLVPADRLARTEQMVAELQATGIEQRLPMPGARLPEFALKTAAGKLVRSSDLLALGPLVLKFFRGRWDPYDMTELEAWSALQADVRRRRALFVAISPQTQRQNAFTADRHTLPFPILSDPGCGYAEQLGLTYTVPDPTRLYYRSMLVNIPFLNGDETWRLPLPATFVLKSDGAVLYAAGFADHRLRPEPEAAMEALNEALSETVDQELI